MMVTIFWDFDGTLGHKGFSQTLLRVLDDHMPEHDIVRKDLSCHLKSGFPWHTPEQPHLHLNKPEKWWDVVEDIFKKAYINVGIKKEIAKVFSKYAHEYYIYPDSFNLYQETMKVLTSLKAKGYHQIILSNHVPELPEIIKGLGLNEFIDDCVTSALVGYEKPHPEIYRYAISRVKSSDNNLWMVGDNVEADIKGAERMGINAILVDRKGTKDNVEYKVKRLTEIENIIFNSNKNI